MIQFHSKPTPNRVCKFVKVAGQYRFFLKNAYDTHRDAVALSESAEAAGILVERDHDWVMIADRSTSLDVGCQPVHHQELSLLLGKPEDVSA